MRAVKLAALSLGLLLPGARVIPADAAACHIDATISGQRSVTCVEMTTGIPAAGGGCDLAKAAQTAAAVPGAKVDYTEMPSCPAGHKGGCKPSRGPATVYYYDQAAADMARQSCNDKNPIMPGTWISP